MHNRRARPRRTPRTLARVFARGTRGRLRARDALRHPRPDSTIEESGFFLCLVFGVAGCRPGCRQGVVRVSPGCRQGVSWVSSGCRQGVGTKRREEVCKSRRNHDRHDRIDTTGTPNRDEIATDTTESRRNRETPSTLFSRASGIRSSFSQFFCPPLRIFTKSLFFLPSTAHFYKSLVIVFLPSTAQWRAGGQKVILFHRKVILFHRKVIEKS